MFRRAIEDGYKRARHFIMTRPPRRARATTRQEKLDTRTMSCKVKPGLKEQFSVLADHLDISPSALQAKLIEAFVVSQQDSRQPSLQDDALTHLQDAGRAYIDAKRDGRVTPLEEHGVNERIVRFQAAAFYGGHGEAA